MPKTINVIAKVTNEVYEAESLGFRHECDLVYEREYQMILKGWEALLSDSPTRSAEEIAA
jgi:hypothetical protein